MERCRTRMRTINTAATNVKGFPRNCSSRRPRSQFDRNAIEPIINLPAFRVEFARESSRDPRVRSPLVVFSDEATRGRGGRGAGRISRDIPGRSRADSRIIRNSMDSVFPSRRVPGTRNSESWIRATIPGSRDHLRMIRIGR